MEVLIICQAAFFTAILTFFSGFGPGIILTPVFAASLSAIAGAYLGSKLL